MRGWNCNHHPVIRPADFQGQGRARDLVRDLLAAMVAAQSRFEQRHRIVRQQRQAKGTQRSLGISQGVDLTRPCRGKLKRLLLDSRVVDVPMSYHPIVMTLSSVKPFFGNGLHKALPCSDNVGAEGPGIQQERAGNDHRGRTDDGTLRRGGSPLGSGGMASSNTCLCHVRLKRSGAWWYEERSNQMLALRCAKYNGTFDQVLTRSQHQKADA